MKKDYTVHLRKLIIVFLCLFIFGCATVPYFHPPVYYSGSNDATGIKIEFSRHMGQFGVIGHLVKINDKEYIRVEAVSELPVYLPPGHYELQVSSIGSLIKSAFVINLGMDGVVYGFGKPSEVEIDLKENEIKRIEYMAPSLIGGKGRIMVKN